MRAVGCRRCRLRSRRPPEVTPPPFGRRAAPFLVCSPLVDAPPRLSATAAWVPALVARRRRVPPVPPPPFGLRPPSAPLTAPLPGGCVCPRRSGRYGTVRLLFVGRWRLRAPAQESSSHSAEANIKILHLKSIVGGWYDSVVHPR